MSRPQPVIATGISVCIATYRRTERLRAVLDDLARQTCLPDEVIVVDNDASGSAKPVMDDMLKTGMPFVIKYEIQPERNIALTRNRTVALADGDWLAFIDDDERAPPTWLQQLRDVTLSHHAAGVLGPVIPQVPAAAPNWIQRGRFYDFPRMHTGGIVPLNRLRFGNVLLSGAVLRAEPGPFDPNYGLTTGEDADMLARLVKKGAHIIWCDEAVVYEPVEPARLSLRWLLRRALSGGQEFGRKSLRGTYGRMSFTGRMRFFCQALLQLLMATGLTLLSWPFGRHTAAKWLLKVAANLGKLSIFWGWHFREYA
jgi:succinoglycan biosynthesis protein ExoM